MELLSTFAAFFRGGGPFMFVILGTAVLIAAITMERFWVIAQVAAFNHSRFLVDLQNRLSKGQTEEATDLCRKVKAPAARVALAILASGDHGREALWDNAEGEAAVVLPPLSHRLPHLAMLANVATLLGLLGTIFGLTTAFAAVGAADPSQRSAFLAAGISQALNTTAFGLIVAVPALIVHGYLVGRVERVAENIDEMSHRLVQMLAWKSKRPAVTPHQSVVGTSRMSEAGSVRNETTVGSRGEEVVAESDGGSAGAQHADEMRRREIVHVDIR